METEEKVCIWIKEYWRFTQDVLPEHKLVKDFDLWGDDAIYFFQDFAKEFNVDFSELELDKKLDCGNFYTNTVRIFKAFVLGQKHLLEYEDIKVSELIIAAEEGKWIG